MTHLIRPVTRNRWACTCGHTGTGLRAADVHCVQQWPNARLEAGGLHDNGRQR
jgi:hypothetical protein